MPPRESPERGGIPSSEDTLREYLEHLFDPSSREAKGASEIEMILNELRYLNNEQGMTGLTSSRGVQLPVERLITAIEKTKGLVRDIRDTLLSDANDEMIKQGIDTIAANHGITGTAGLRDAVVRALFNEVKHHQLENNTRL